jgi:hypothetical protein
MLPTNAQDRKDTPIFTGVLLYFPDALAEVARCSKVGNDQHNPGEPLHWAKEKSTDEGDALVRHQLDAGKVDTDGIRHSAKVAWRALAQLQRELEAELKAKVRADLDEAMAQAHTCGTWCVETDGETEEDRMRFADALRLAKGLRYRRTDKMSDHEHLDASLPEAVDSLPDESYTAYEATLAGECS